MAKNAKAKKETPPRLQKMEEKGENKLAQTTSTGDSRSRGGAKKKGGK